MRVKAFVLFGTEVFFVIGRHALSVHITYQNI